MKETQASETSVAPHPTMQRHVPQERISLSYLFSRLRKQTNKFWTGKQTAESKKWTTDPELC
jgi:hypothetical protein